LSFLPDIYQAQSTGMSRRDERALARQMGSSALELLAVDRTRLVERAKIRALGDIGSDAVDEVVRVADAVAICAERNPFGTQLAAKLAIDFERTMERRIERASERLG
jgi:hypothetical protein